MSRKAVDTFCSRCWTHTLTGGDGDVAALNATVDNSPLTRSGELLAVISGRQVYAVDIRGALHRRDRWMLRRPSAEAVVAEHRCDSPLPTAWLAPPSPRPPVPIAKEPF